MTNSASLRLIFGVFAIAFAVSCCSADVDDTILEKKSNIPGEVAYQRNGLPRMRFGKRSGTKFLEELAKKRPADWYDIPWVWKRDGSVNMADLILPRPGMPGLGKRDFLGKRDPDWHDLGWTWG